MHARHRVVRHVVLRLRLRCIQPFPGHTVTASWDHLLGHRQRGAVRRLDQFNAAQGRWVYEFVCGTDCVEAFDLLVKDSVAFGDGIV